MNSIVSLYSMKNNEIKNFLNTFYNQDITLENDLQWSKTYDNPVEIAGIIGAFIDNNDKYDINMWVSLDEGVYINVTDHNADEIIRYLYERYPY